MNSTIFVGIGSTGLHILEEIQQFHYEAVGANKPGGNVEFLYCETDVSNLPKNTALGNSDIHQIPLSLGGNEVAIKDLKSNKFINHDWLPRTEVLMNNEIGAGSKPNFGRLSLWAGNNYRRFREELSSKYRNVHQHDTARNTRIVVVGSLSGGTGSGLCVDIAYLIKDITGIGANIYGIFVLPSKLGYSASGKMPYENTFVSLASIDYFSKEGNKYSVVWPDGTLYEQHGPPYSQIHYLSTDFSSAVASTSFEELKRAAGILGLMYILNSNVQDVTTFSDFIARRNIDNRGNDLVGPFRTMGFKFIEYPKSKLEELLSVIVSKNILSSLLDTVNYIDFNGRIRSLESLKIEIRISVKSKLESIVEVMFNDVLGREKIRRESACESLFKKGLKSGVLIAAINDEFTSLRRDNFFYSVSNSSNDFEKQFINDIESFLNETLDKYQNVEALKMAIDGFILAIDDVVNFYKNYYGLTGSTDAWNQRLGYFITIFSQEFSGILWPDVKMKYLQYHFSELLKLSFLNTLINIIPSVKRKMLSSDSITSICSKGYIENHIVKRIKRTLDSDEDSGINLERRESQLRFILSKNEVSFINIYENGSYVEDLKRIQQDYENKNKKLTSKILFDSKSLWSFFKDNKDLDFYQHVILRSKDFIEGLNLFEDKNIFNVLQQITKSGINSNARVEAVFKANKQGIRSYLPPMIECISGDNGFQFNDDIDSLYLYIMSSDSNQVRSLFKNYEINKDNATDLPALSNAIFVYQEYGAMRDNTHFNPLTHVSWTPALISKLRNDLKDMNENDLDKYRRTRLAYLTIDQFIKYLS